MHDDCDVFHRGPIRDRDLQGRRVDSSVTAMSLAASIVAIITVVVLSAAAMIAIRWCVKIGASAQGPHSPPDP